GAAAEEDRGDRPAARLVSVVVELGKECPPPLRLVDRRPDMAVEVAIRAFRQAERPVDVDAEGDRLGRRHLTFPQANLPLPRAGEGRGEGKGVRGRLVPAL